MPPLSNSPTRPPGGRQDWPRGSIRPDLTFSGDSALGGRNAPSDDGQVAPGPFAAVQEQLGLKLEAKKAPAEILVIDYAEKLAEH